MADRTPLERLVALFRASGVIPELTPERDAPSTEFDLEYRVLVVALAFHMHAAVDRFSPNRPRLQARKLKLLQFIAMRPWLVHVVRDWSQQRREGQRSLDTEEGLRRGFLSDTVHDHVMRFLESAGVFRRDGDHVVTGPHANVVSDFTHEIEERRLFANEIAALLDLQSIIITNDMLVGW
jgi:hypothetical protein